MREATRHEHRYVRRFDITTPIGDSVHHTQFYVFTCECGAVMFFPDDNFQQCRPAVQHQVRSLITLYTQPDVTRTPLPPGWHDAGPAWRAGMLSEAQIAELRERVMAGEATHDCGEWVKDGRCQLCDRAVS